MPDRNFRRHRPLYSNTLPKDVKEPKIKWKLIPIIWLSLKRMATVLGFLVIINLVMALIIIPALLPKKQAAPSLPNEMVLFLKFEDGLIEMPGTPSFADPFAKPPPTVKDIVQALDHASGDKRVKGIVARMYSGSFSLAQASEVRDAVKRFRASGKFAHIYSTSYGDAGVGLGRYYLASAFDEIWMQPLGIVSVTGVSAEIPFFREALDKIGVTPQFFKRKDYKTAYESITDKSISKENRETMDMIIADIRKEILDTVPAERDMSAADFERLVNKGLFTAPEAEEAGLVTHVDYGDVLLKNIAESLTGERDIDAIDLVDMPQYIRATKKNSNMLIGASKPKVALVYAVGAIMPSSDGGGLASDGIAAADEIAPAILAAAEDDDVDVIVLRIDSPGGSPSASESILRAVERVQDEHAIPVVVSMGQTAASGGYWIAAYADKIYALPTTLTGSIGVVGGKFALGDLADKAGVNWEEVSWGRNSGLWSPVDEFSASEAAQMNNMLDEIYKSFVARVAKGRAMTPNLVDEIAGGRVWTGRRAVDVGLVDEIGGLTDALDYAAFMSGKEDRDDINVVIYPKPKSSVEQLLALLGAQATLGQSVKWQGEIAQTLQPLLQAVHMQQNPDLYTTYEPITLR